MSRKVVKSNVMTPNIILFTGLCALTCGTLKIFEKIYETQPEPYIDEVFHVPQAQLYCRNIWTEWNPKITTLPGLYLITYAFLKPQEILHVNVCDIYFLRLVNVLGTLINFLLSYRILSKVHNVSGSKSLKNIFLSVVSACNIAIFPPLYFFTFLYYTDIWSLTFVLLMYHEHLSSHKHSKSFAALAGMFAVLIRQTNVIWVGLMVLDDSWKVLVSSRSSKKAQDYNFAIETLKSLISYMPRKKIKKEGNKKTIFLLVHETLRSTKTYLIVCVGFILFVLINGSIVVGDKSAHSAVFHPMQSLYFLDFAAFFGLPYLVHRVVSRKVQLPNMYLVGILLGVSALLSEVNKLEHSYLLADNRHYAFYIWKRILGQQTKRRIVIPTYSVACILICDLLKHRPFMFKAILAVCIFLNLSFQHLFELRYFIIPFVMCRLQFQQNISVLVELIFFILINTVTIYLFVNKPFYWESEPNMIQRFIW